MNPRFFLLVTTGQFKVYYLCVVFFILGLAGRCHDSHRRLREREHDHPASHHVSEGWQLHGGEARAGVADGGEAQAGRR